MATQGSDNSMQATLAAAAAGDEAAWRSLVEQYTRRVYALLAHQCRDRELAEELTQATFVKLFDQLRRQDGYREQGRFEAYLFRIAMNHLRDEMRRRKRQARTMDVNGQDFLLPPQQSGREQRAPLERMQHEEQVRKLRTAIAAMSESDQQILHLRHTAGMAFAEIAETLGEPLGTVLARAHRALKKLREMLGPEALEMVES